MSRVDVYCNQLTETKPQGTIIVLEAENKLLELKASELQKLIDSNNETLKTLTEDKIKNHMELNIKELELRIMELTTKARLNTIMITRINTSINNLKQ
jgi:tRNA threonylcarbamoyladenosine modification (KEOPS) complex Cgi121 subunit